MTNHKACVSLVVPLHNATAWLAPFLDSILAQTCGDFEVLVLDCASVDDGPERVAALCARDARFRLLRLNACRGADVAFDAGVRAATAPFVCFASPHDVLPPRSLEVRLAACKQHMAVVRGSRETVCAGVVTGRETPPPGLPPVVDPAQAVPSLTLNDFLQAPWTWMFPTGLLRRYPVFRYTSTDLLEKVTRLVWLPDVVYSRVVRPGVRRVWARLGAEVQKLANVVGTVEHSLRTALAEALAAAPALAGEFASAGVESALPESFSTSVVQGLHLLKAKDTPLAALTRQLGTLKAQALAQGRDTKLEVVIFPYKTCVFDSVESIWRAAAADPDCEAHLVPIPYFERAPDGTFTRMCYEGGDFPEGVPVEDWRDYDVEARHPDIVIIHNPWDDTNGLTSVHPHFYARRLKDMCGALVYVPYFVSLENTLRPFYACHPGALHAAKVIVQSEEIRRQYIAFFKEFEEKYQCAGRFGRAEDKFVALGSPKYDKLDAASNTHQSLPASWRALLARPDGTRKPAVFFNTSVVHIGPYGKRYIQKIRETIEFFAAQDAIVLWWRPHPLALPEMARCHPGLLEEYMALVQSYKDSGKGIYDDTPEPYLAVCETQGYCGEMSSLVEMYRKEGTRPILLLRTTMLRDTPVLDADVFEDVLDDDAYFWCLAATRNALFSLPVSGDTLDPRCLFPGEVDRPHIFSACVKQSDTIYCAPHAAGGVGVFHCDSGTVDCLDVGQPPCVGPLPYDEDAKFGNLFVHDKALFLVGKTWPGIMRFDPQTGERTCYSDMVRDCAAGAGVYWNSARHCHGATLCLPAAADNRLFFFDMETGSWEAHAVGAGEAVYADVGFDGTEFWLLHATRPELVRWNRQTGACATVDMSAQVQLAPEQEKRLNEAHTPCIPFGKLLYAHDAVWVFPHHAACPVRVGRDGTVDMLTTLGEVYAAVLAQNGGDEPVCVTTQAKCQGEYLLLLLDSRKICRYTPATDAVELFAGAERTLTRACRTKGDDAPGEVNLERNMKQLPWLVDALARASRSAPRRTASEVSNVGEKIYAYCKKTLAGR